jgi:hypothetical protein
MIQNAAFIFQTHFACLCEERLRDFGDGLNPL